EQIRRLPFTTADELQQAGMEMVCVSQAEIARVVTLDTSGTTGAPKRLYFTHADQELTVDFFQHGMSTFTRPGQRVLVLLPFERPGSVGDLLAAGLRRMQAEPVLYGPVRDPQHTLALIQEHRIDGLVGSPAHVLALARGSTRWPGAWRPGWALLSIDRVPAAAAAAIADAWGCAVYNHYGMTEMGLGGGVDCQARAGYHLREADLYVELIDPASGEPAAPGAPGEVVFTTLTRQGMPLVRYRTGDESRWLAQPCACGTQLHTLAHVQRRLAGQVDLLPGGAAQPGEAWGAAAARPAGSGAARLGIEDLDEALFALPGVLNFSAVLSGDRRQARLELALELLPGAPGDWPAQAAAALEELPALQAARRAGRLALQVTGQSYPGPLAGSLAKRKIVDRRRLINA
ncbi:MAG: DVU_1553 family AMP-dependent CoA ligase, partial [Chloroflexota bacterium]